MKELDHEHRSFEKYAKSEGLNREMHPLHLLYLDDTTNMALSVFKAGYSAGKEHLTDLQAQNDELRAHASRLANALVICNAQHKVNYVGNGLVREALDKTPAQSLADIRAEAESKGAIKVLSGLTGNVSSLIKDAENSGNNDLLLSLMFMQRMIKEYANKIKGAE